MFKSEGYEAIFSPCSYGQFPKVVYTPAPLETWGAVLVVGVTQQMVSLVLLLRQLAFFPTQCSVLKIRRHGTAARRTHLFLV